MGSAAKTTNSRLEGKTGDAKSCPWCRRHLMLSARMHPDRQGREQRSDEATYIETASRQPIGNKACGAGWQLLPLGLLYCSPPKLIGCAKVQSQTGRHAPDLRASRGWRGASSNTPPSGPQPGIDRVGSASSPFTSTAKVQFRQHHPMTANARPRNQHQVGQSTKVYIATSYGIFLIGQHHFAFIGLKIVSCHRTAVAAAARDKRSVWRCTNVR